MWLRKTRLGRCETSSQKTASRGSTSCGRPLDRFEERRMNSLYLGAYWSDRAELLDDCAKRLRAFLADLGRSGEILERWISKRKSPVKEVSSRSSLDDV